MSKKRRSTSILDSVSKNTRSKRPKLNDGIPASIPKCWVSPSQLYNYMNNDPIIDWLEFMQRRPNRRSSSFRAPLFNNTFKSFLMDQGNLFENHIIELLKSRNLPVTFISDIYSLSAVEKTKQHLLKGTPILYSAPLCNVQNHTYGIADLIVRSDYLNKLVDVPLPYEMVNQGCSLSPDYYYVVIDIKFSKLQFKNDMLHLCNNASFPYYKGQVWLYTQALNNIQGKESNIALLLGRNWRINSGLFFSNNPLDRFGIVDFKNADEHIVTRVKKAISWRRDLKTYGYSWTYKPPSRNELYPNMCKKNIDWNTKKQEIASQIGEISQLWRCGNKHRNIAFSKGISTIYDTRLNAGILNITNAQHKNIVDKMLKINRNPTTEVIFTKEVVRYHKLARFCK